MRRPSLIASAVLGLLTSFTFGCTFNPINATTFTGTNVGRSITVQGYIDQASTNVRVQVLDPANQDPKNAASTWATIGTGVTSASPYLHNDPDPLYAFTVAATPVANV